MKQKFLALVEAMKKTGLVEASSKTSTAAELEMLWQKFANDNQELCSKIKAWAKEFNENKSDEIFVENEKIKDPLEVAAVISIIRDESVSECEIFERWEDLAEKIININTAFAKSVGKFIARTYLCYITPEDIFMDKKAKI